MKKFNVKMPGKEKEQTLLIKSNKEAEWDGQEFEYEHKFISKKVLLLRIGNRNHIVKMESNDDGNAELVIDARRYFVECKSQLDIVKEKYIGKENSRFKEKIISPMPGAVVKVNVSEGEEVKAGDVLLVLEAMKMENEIKSDTDCVVKKLHVEERISVDKGQLLVTLAEPSTE